MRKLVIPIVIGIFSIFGLHPAQADWNYITLSSYYVQPTQSISVYGNGFSAGESVTISIAGQNKTISANDSGQFNSPQFSIPYSVIGQTIPVVANGSSGHTSTANLVVGTYYPNVTPSSYYIVPGGSISFSGVHFAPGEQVSINGGSIQGSATADGAGNWQSGNFTTPFTAGDVQYNFAGQTSGIHSSVVVHVSGTQAIITLNNYYGYSGSGLQVQGKFFGSGEEVKVMMGEMSLGSITTTANGDFTLNTTVPSFNNSSAQNVIAVGQTTGKTATTQFTVAWNNQANVMQGAVSLVSVDMPNAPVIAGQNFNVTPKLIASGSNANNVTVTVALNSGMQNVSQQYSNQTLLQNTPQNFPLQVTGNLGAGNYTLSTSVQNADSSILAAFPSLGTVVIH